MGVRIRRVSGVKGFGAIGERVVAIRDFTPLLRCAVAPLRRCVMARGAVREHALWFGRNAGLAGFGAAIDYARISFTTSP